MEFGNTKWDIRDWSEEQKVQFQEKCFELGYGWKCGGKTAYYVPVEVIYLNGNGEITWGFMLKAAPFKNDHRVEKTWEDMFPTPTTPKLDVVDEIVSMVFPEEGEKEDGFVDLVYKRPNYIEGYYVIPLNIVSEEQLEFLKSELPFHPHGELLSHEVPVGLASQCGEDDWFFCTKIDNLDTRITFNELFQYKEV